MMMYKFCPQTKVQLLQKSVCRAVPRGWCLTRLTRNCFCGMTWPYTNGHAVGTSYKPTHSRVREQTLA